MWASTFDCAVVLIGHLSKRENSKDLYRGLGSIDVVASARSVLQVERNPADPEVRIVHQIKNSLAPVGEDLSFEISANGGFKYLIKKMLVNGPVESSEIRKTMLEHRIGEKTMNDAKKELGIKPFRKMRVWYWEMPGEETE